MFLFSVWRSVPLPTRIKIATAFGIAKVGPTHVRDNYVESDGYKIEDVERALNVDALQKYTGLESTDMAVLFNAVVAIAEGVQVVQVPAVDTSTTVAESMAKPEKIKVIPPEPKKRGRKAKAK